MADHQESDQKAEMPQGPLLFRQVLPGDPHFHQGNGSQGNNPQQIGHDGQLIRPALPVDPGHHVHQEIQHHQGKIHPGGNSQPVVPGLPASRLAVVISGIEFCSHQGFRQHHRDHHKEDQVPGLVGRQKIHIIRHNHCTSLLHWVCFISYLYYRNTICRWWEGNVKKI